MTTIIPRASGAEQPRRTPARSSRPDDCLHLLVGKKAKRTQYVKLPRRYALDIGKEICLDLAAEKHGFAVTTVPK